MTKRVALHARVSSEKTQTTETRLRQLREVAQRLGEQVVAEHTDEGISGAHGRDTAAEAQAVATSSAGTHPCLPPAARATIRQTARPRSPR